MNQFIKLMRAVKGFRTFTVNILLTIMPVLEMNEMIDILPDGYEAKYAIMIALVNLYLRTITTTPLGKS